jgi:4a-hydroxytetrahydrobiopterin dehydratase
MARKAMSETELTAALADLPGWEIKAGKLHKQFQFGNFSEALGWMVQVGVIAEKMDHHPEWSNVYNRVNVDLVTHDLGNAISTWDVELAKKMETAAA